MLEKNVKFSEEQEKPIAIPVVPYEAKETPRIVCVVCGHANPIYTAICKKCSNYLMQGEEK